MEAKNIEQIIKTFYNNFLFVEDSLEGFEYEIPSDKKKLMYDFYMISVLFPPEVLSSFPNMDETLLFTIKYSKEKLCTYLKEEFLNIIFFSAISYSVRSMKHTDSSLLDTFLKQLSTPEKKLFIPFLEDVGGIDVYSLYPEKEFKPVEKHLLAKGPSHSAQEYYKAATVVDPSRINLMNILIKYFSFMTDTKPLDMRLDMIHKSAEQWIALYKANTAQEQQIIIDKIYNLSVYYKNYNIFSDLDVYEDSDQWMKYALKDFDTIKNPYELFHHNRISFSMQTLVARAFNVLKEPNSEYTSLHDYLDKNYQGWEKASTKSNVLTDIISSFEKEKPRTDDRTDDDITDQETNKTTQTNGKEYKVGDKVTIITDSNIVLSDRNGFQGRGESTSGLKGKSAHVYRILPDVPGVEGDLIILKFKDRRNNTVYASFTSSDTDYFIHGNETNSKENESERIFKLDDGTEYKVGDKIKFHDGIKIFAFDKPDYKSPSVNGRTYRTSNYIGTIFRIFKDKKYFHKPDNFAFIKIKTLENKNIYAVFSKTATNYFVKYNRSSENKEELNESGLTGFNYEIPKKDKSKLLYDFYVSTILTDNKGNIAPIKNQGMVSDLDLHNLAFTVNYAKFQLYTYLRNEMLNTTFFSLSAEIRHVLESNSIREIRDILSSQEFDIFGRYIKKLGAYKSLGLQTRASYSSKDDKKYLRDLFSDSSTNYKISYNAAKSADPDMVNMVRIMQSLYTNANWNTSYGGIAWANICKGWLKLYEANANGPEDIKNINEMMVWIDHVYDLQHNTGSVFTKVKKYAMNGGYSWLKTALDDKRDTKNPYDLFDKISFSMRKLAGAVIYAKEGTSLEKYLNTKTSSTDSNSSNLSGLDNSDDNIIDNCSFKKGNKVIFKYGVYDSDILVNASPFSKDIKNNLKITLSKQTTVWRVLGKSKSAYGDINLECLTNNKLPDLDFPCEYFTKIGSGGIYSNHLNDIQINASRKKQTDAFKTLKVGDKFKIINAKVFYLDGHFDNLVGSTGIIDDITIIPKSNIYFIRVKYPQEVFANSVGHSVSTTIKFHLNEFVSGLLIAEGINYFNNLEEDTEDPTKNYKNWKNPPFKDAKTSGRKLAEKAIKRWNDLATGKTPDSNFTSKNREPLTQLEEYIEKISNLDEAKLSYERTGDGKFISRLKKQYKSVAEGHRVDRGKFGGKSERKMNLSEKTKRMLKARQGNIKAKKTKHIAKIKKVNNARNNPFAKK